MKTLIYTKLKCRVGITAVIIVSGTQLLELAKAAETNVFQWTDRPQLSIQQQKLLQSQSGIETLRTDSPLHAETQAQIAALQKDLGSNVVRVARPNELISSNSEKTSTIFNPTKEGLVLSVSVVGDTEQIGSRRASMARQTYLPPHSTVIISNLYWTSPATKSLK